MHIILCTCATCVGVAWQVLDSGCESMERVDHTAQLHISTASPDGSARSYPSLISRPRLAFRWDYGGAAVSRCRVFTAWLHSVAAPALPTLKATHPHPSIFKARSWWNGHNHTTTRITLPRHTIKTKQSHLQAYYILGNFRVIKCSHKNISWSKFFALWTFCENLTCRENMEENGRDWCICCYQVHHEIWWQAYLPISAPTVWLTILPVCPTRCGTDGFFHFLICCRNCLGWYWGWQQPLGSGRQFSGFSYLNKAIFAISFTD